MIPSPECNCADSTSYVEHLKSQRLLQFLMGLNESFRNIRSNILARKSVVTVNEAYVVAAQEENQRALKVIYKTRDALTLLASMTQGYKSKPKKFVPPETICDHCGFKGHFKADCYRLVGYPPDFKSKRKGTDDFKLAYTHLTKNVDDFPKSETLTHMSPTQYQDLVNKMDRIGTSDCAANMSGTLQWQRIEDW
ncbi:uncharacterized protein LOC129900963 [Solanum dulcamara]|uniref:uncharacterized protein LOC129900963 n=1 Tax=Solanum dulcamara TaxID=45834 RepID=UPI0024858359|nr:uncharacterized protein LOC129900963 [Solanum dulcamara]